MGSFYHKLKANKTKAKPRNWIFVDTEARITPLGDGGEVHGLRLGFAQYHRDVFEDHAARMEVFEFTSSLRFWHWAREVGERDRRTVVIGYNMGYDMLILNGFRCLRKLGYSQKRIYVGQGTLILEFARKKQKLLILDAMNYFDGSLEQWGDMLGIEKIPVNFRRVSDRKLMEHCKADVDILRELWKRWLDFVDDNDLGTFSPTKASQALTAFRHRYMDKEIMIHAHAPATEIERHSYTGGRTECFWIGKPPGKMFYKLDVNSMYPFIMKTIPVPCKLIRWVQHSTKDELRNVINSRSVIALCKVKTPEPVFPYRDAGTLCFPTGTFWAYLTTSEVRYALLYDYIIEVRDVCLYDQAVLFADYVRAMYRLRQKFARCGNRIFEKMVKYLLNCLYGKFGQHSEVWEKQDKVAARKDGTYTLYNLDQARWFKMVVIAGEVWYVYGPKEAYHSFTAISSHITAAARMYLWTLIVQAGRKNVFYCDTDSLIVNAAGYRKLKGRLHDTKLGRLKLEYKSQNLTIYSPKDYETDQEKHCKGLKSDAEMLSPNVYRQLQWSKLQGSISTGRTGVVTLRPVTKTMERRYKKGRVYSSGAVEPFTIAD